MRKAYKLSKNEKRKKRKTMFFLSLYHYWKIEF